MAGKFYDRYGVLQRQYAIILCISQASQSEGLLHFAAGSAAAGRICREEGICGEADLAEHFAWVLHTAGVVAAFLCRDTIFAVGDLKLGVALQPNRGKLSERDIETLFLSAHDQVPAHARKDCSRDFRDGGFTVVMLVVLHDFCRKDHRIDDIDDRFGLVAISQGVAGDCGILAAEALCLSGFAAEHDPLAENCKAAEYGGLGTADRDIAEDFIIECNIDGIVSAIVWNCLKVYVCVQQLTAACLRAGSLIERVLRFRRKINPEILHAILVKATVCYLLCMDADSLSGITSEGRAIRYSV